MFYISTSSHDDEEIVQVYSDTEDAIECAKGNEI